MAAASAAFSLLLSCVSAADADGNRRILHEPLYPIQWTPPPPPSDDADPFPQSPAPPLASPTQPDAASTQTTADASVSAPTHHSITVPAKLAIGVSASVCTVAILSLFAYFLHRRRARTPSESRKLIAGNGDSRRFVPPDRPATAASAEFLYLGTMEPAVPGRRPSAESNGSPYRKLISERERVLELQHPSPELHPLPPLTGLGRRLDPPLVTPPPPPPPPAASSDDDTYYTPNRSVASRNSESSGSPRSRRSHAASSAAGKDARTASPVDNVPRSRRSSPRMQLSSDVNRGSSAAPRAAPPPPPPPPPPPLLPKTEKVTKLTPPPPPPLLPKTEKVIKLPPSLPQDIVRGNREASPQLQALPAWPSSRRQLLRPLPPEDAARADVRAPIARLINAGCSSSMQPGEEAGDDLESEAKPKLKPLHWDKVLASSGRAMVWDQLKSDTFQLNEDMIETLFLNNSAPPPPKEQNRRAVFPPLKQEDRVLDPKKSQNIAILLRALNVTREEVSEALLDGNTDGLGSELLETLVKMAPTKEEELKLRDYNGDVSKLGSAERFLKAVLDIPFAFRRVDVMLYRANFDTEVKYLRTSFETLEAACEDLTSSRLFLKLLEAVLRTGNRMNVGTNRGEAKAFKLDTLLKLADVKGTDGKTTLLQFVVQEIIRSEGSASEAAAENHPSKAKEEEFRKHGLQVVSGLSSELRNVKKAAGMDSDVLSSYLSKLELGLEKIRSVLQLGGSCEQGQMFFDNTRNFLQEAELEIVRVKSEEKRALRRVREVTEYFHGDAAKEGAHPLRIFLVVRDFLTVLDNVCKDVRRLHERTMMGSAKSFRISASSSLPVLQRYAPRPEAISDEDSSSS